jgi:hypothetical protein
VRGIARQSSTDGAWGPVRGRVAAAIASAGSDDVLPTGRNLTLRAIPAPFRPAMLWSRGRGRRDEVVVVTYTRSRSASPRALVIDRWAVGLACVARLGCDDLRRPRLFHGVRPRPGWDNRRQARGHRHRNNADWPFLSHGSAIDCEVAKYLGHVPRTSSKPR